MNKRIIHIAIFFFLLFSGASLGAQESYPGLGFWRFKTITGEVSMMGQYQDQVSEFGDIYEDQSSRYFTGGVKLNTSSFLWQPEIVTLNINGEYNPETRNEQYLTIPDRSEVRTLKRLDIRSTIFNKKSISLTPYINLNQNYFNRENLTNIKSDNRQWGGIISLNNSILPLSITYRSLQWSQMETESGRQFDMNQNSLQGRISKSFYGVDKHNLTYAYDDYQYTYTDLNSINNVVHRVTLNDNFYFDKERKYGYNSLINYYNQAGNHTFNKIEASERLIFHLPVNLDFNTGYNYYRMEDLYQLININSVSGVLRHQLFESLTSETFIDYSKTNHTLYGESDLKTGIEFKYTKKIAIGQLNLGYRFYRQYKTVDSEESSINILYEQHTLSDLEGTFLDKPYVNTLSVVIRDVSGTVIYQEGLDYLVDIVSNYAEIYRIPGGQILQGQEVLISYTAIQPGSNHYEANNNTFNANLVLFNRLLNIYYKGSVQNFNNVLEADFLTLNQYNQNVVGARLYYKNINGGVEYDYYNSSIIPYKRVNYFLNLNFKIKSKFLISVNSTLRDYMLIGNDLNHRYINVSCRVAYKITNSSRLNLQAGYLSQNGRNIDLDLITGRLEFVTNLRKMYLTAGLNFYSKKYTSSDFTYKRGYVQLTRKF